VISADSESRPEATFGKDKRLLTAKDYSRVFNGAEVKVSHKNLLLLAIKTNEPGHRLGLVIAKKNIRLAVQRNRMKRIAREFFRSLPVSENSMDIVLLARRGMDKLDNAELYSILRQQWQKIEGHAAKQNSTAPGDQ
jgi:ribonuclease P protein component